MILVAGGTGRLGRLVVAILQQRSARVRVLTRNPRNAVDLAAAGVEVVRGDVRDPDSLADAVRGVRSVVAAVQGLTGGATPEIVDHEGNVHLADAAAQAGAHVVLVSVAGAAPDAPTGLLRAKAAAEQHVRESVPSWAIVRASPFAETWIDLLEGTAAASGRPTVLGRGDNPVTFVCVHDVACVVADATLDTAHRGNLIQVAGREAVTLTDLAERVQARAGRTAPPRHVSPAALRLAAATIGLVRADLRRQARAALAMDAGDLVAQSSPTTHGTPMAACLSGHATVLR